MAKEIQLSQGAVALVSDEDFERVNQYKWSLVRLGRGHAYAARGGGPKNTVKFITLHRFLMDAPKDMQVDHVNGNTLDNRRENLRLCTHAENMRNRVSRTGSSQYKGVSLRKVDGKWIAQIAGRYVGTFTDEAEAARAYDRAALEQFGEFARLNFPTEEAA